MNSLMSVYCNSKTTKCFSANYLKYVASLLTSINAEEVDNVIGLIREARANGRKVFVVGNGGSAATASHLANDLAIGVRAKESHIKCISLSDNQAILTALGNDNGYDDVFTAQLKVYAEKGDIVIAISASGNSPNLVEAVNFGRANGLVTVGFLGFDGGRLNELCEHRVLVKTAPKEYGPVEDAHMVLVHLLGNFFALTEKHGELGVQ